MQDSKGYIWFSTEAGLCRYNGSDILLFDEKRGLKEKACYSVKEDSKGNLWIATSANRILCYKNDSLQEAPFSSSYANYFLKSKSLEQTYLFQFENDNCFWLNTQNHTYLGFSNRNNIQMAPPETSDADYYFLQQGNKYVPIKNKTRGQLNNYNKTHPNQLKIILKNKGVETCIYIPHIATSNPSWRALTCTANNGKSYFAFENLLLVVDKQLHYTVKELPNNILSLYCDKADGIWVGMLKAGIRYFPESNNLDHTINSLSDYTVTGICVDHEQGVWCSTLEKGVFYCRSKFIVGYDNVAGLHQKADLLKCINNTVYVATEANSIVEMNKGQIIKHTLQLNTPFLINDILPQNKSWLVGGKGFTATASSNFENTNLLLYEKTTMTAGSNQFAVDTKNNQTYSIHFGDVLSIKDSKLIPLISPLESPGRCIFYSNEMGLLIGCKEGLFVVNTEDRSCKRIAAIDGNITKIIERSNHKLWVSTKESGIYIIHNNKVSRLQEKLPLPTNRFYDLTEDAYGTLWIGSNIGLIKYSDKNGLAQFQIFNTHSGLPSDEIFHVATDSSAVYLATNEGVCSVSLNSPIKNNNPPTIYLCNLWVNEQVQNTKNNKLIFSHDENSLKLDFDVLSFKSNVPTNLVYSLHSDHTEIQYNKGSEIILNNLAPGNYQLSVFGCNNDNVYSTKPFQLNFEIQSPIWKTPGFIFFGLLALVMFIYLGVKNIISQIRKKEEEKTRINKLLAEHQLSALKAQMNPHFIFNCINSIQRYILTNKSEEAYGYLTQFSKLIRLVLNYSDKNRITLAQELEIIELYMKLEKLRFENKFNYTINCQPEIDVENTLIPAMMLQPYIENAIWHGIMNLKKEQQGHIHIQVLSEKGLLKIIIEDNGVGRAQAALLSPKNHESKGTNINQMRASIIHMIENTSNVGGVVIEDILGSNGEIAGTRVIIQIPQTTIDNEN